MGVGFESVFHDDSTVYTIEIYSRMWEWSHDNMSEDEKQATGYCGIHN